MSVEKSVDSWQCANKVAGQVGMGRAADNDDQTESSAEHRRLFIWAPPDGLVVGNGDPSPRGDDRNPLIIWGVVREVVAMTLD
jgi:hypothetical protein